MKEMGIFATRVKSQWDISPFSKQDLSAFMLSLHGKKYFACQHNFIGDEGRD
jgi:hypothetical protein